MKALEEQVKRAEQIAHIAEMYQQLNAEHRTELLITIVAMLDENGLLETIPLGCEPFVMVARALIHTTAPKVGQHVH